jgi:site-specific DNA-methyltransferase (adenine-specific)
MEYINQIIQGDCLEVMKGIPDKSINLIIADPPYNIGKADWDKIPNYIEWLGSRLLEMQRVLKDNGSFYLFHNDFLQMVKIQNWINKNGKFIFKSLITINKTDNNYIKDLYGSQNHFRNYMNIVEYILFYTFQDETGLSTVFNNPNCFRKLKEYFYNEKKKGNFNNKDINKILDTAINGSGMAGHYFKKDLIQWTLPTKEMYQKLQLTGYFKREYENLRQEYENLRQEYENLRYTFNKKEGLINVWEYSFREEKQYKHPTQKPIRLIKDIIKYSSNEGDLTLDCFFGTGTTGVACKNLKRNYIGIEISPEYCEIARKRIKAIPELLFV